MIAPSSPKSSLRFRSRQIKSTSYFFCTPWNNTYPICCNRHTDRSFEHTNCGKLDHTCCSICGPLAWQCHPKCTLWWHKLSSVEAALPSVAGSFVPAATSRRIIIGQIYFKMIMPIEWLLLVGTKRHFLFEQGGGVAARGMFNVNKMRLYT